VSAGRGTGDLLAVAAQGSEHLEQLRALLGREAPPDLAALERSVAATRALRGSATLAGLDSFQAFLGRLFQLLEDVGSSAVPWSARLEAVLCEAELAEAGFVAELQGGTSERSDEGIVEAEGRLAAWRREEAQRRPEAAPRSDAQREMSQSAASDGLRTDLETMRQQIHRLQTALSAQGLPDDGLASEIGTLQRDIATLHRALAASVAQVGEAPERGENCLQNHCEGALRHLVEAAAQEVLDEAKERGLHLALRATGHLEAIDEELGGALLEILSNLWSDSLEAQADRGAARIDTVLGADRQRLLIEVHDPEAGGTRRRDDDVLGRYPGLRRLRPVVEALDGLVWVGPEAVPGCRFRLSLPLAIEQPYALLVQMGRREVALPPAAVEGVHAAADLRADWDEAGAFVEVQGARVPILHLAFLLGDASYDDMRREHVIVVGSFERRAALFASGAPRTTRGSRRPEPEGLWAATLETPLGAQRLLNVGALLGRRGPEPLQPAAAAVSARRGNGAAATRRDVATVLVVDSSEVEREVLKGLLGEAAYKSVAVQSAEEAWSVLGNQPVDLIACDLRLPEMNAQQIAERRRRTGEWAGLPMLLLLTHAGEQSNLVVQQLGASAYVRSPLQREELMTVVRRLTD